nr:RNA-directed DNA polymerase, eukaryota [Tanacetum cinerariifolium]
QLSLLTNLLDTVILSNMEDRWFFDLNIDGRFCVKDVRCLLDDVFLPKAENRSQSVSKNVTVLLKESNNGLLVVSGSGPAVTSNWAVCYTLNPPLLPPIPPEGPGGEAGFTGGPDFPGAGGIASVGCCAATGDSMAQNINPSSGDTHHNESCEASNPPAYDEVNTHFKIRLSIKEPLSGGLRSMKGLSKCKALESNIRRIRVKDIVNEVEDYLKTYSSVGMDIS